MRSEIREGIQSAFISSYGELEAAIYAAFPEATFEDVEAVLLELAATLFTNNRPLIYKAITEALYKAPEDCSKELDDYLQDVFLHLQRHPKKLIGLLFPNRAKPTTVLYGLAKSRMRAERKQLTKRHAKVARCLSELHYGGCEISDPEPTEEEKERMSAVA